MMDTLLLFALGLGLLGLLVYVLVILPSRANATLVSPRALDQSFPGHRRGVMVHQDGDPGNNPQPCGPPEGTKGTIKWYDGCSITDGGNWLCNEYTCPDGFYKACQAGNNMCVGKKGSSQGTGKKQLNVFTSWGMNDVPCWERKSNKWISYADVRKSGGKSECWFRYCVDADTKKVTDKTRCGAGGAPEFLGCYANNTQEHPISRNEDWCFNNKTAMTGG